MSDFLNDLVQGIGRAIDQIRTDVNAGMARVELMEKSLTQAAKTNQDLAAAVTDTLRKSFQAISEKTDQQTEDLRKSMEGLNEGLSRQPARAPKSKTMVLNKSFEGEQSKEMSRDDILKSLTSLFEKGDPNVTSMDIIRFEASGQIAPQVQKVLGLV